ncbi:cell envelope biogenesis protein OmpA [Pleurocapsa sp. CCALA 161]|uniref:OmpA family protein n=1 Tax=Pleurocapsa sp. CCALA 161 TaxID=2107688 RepID=UPI000D04C30D|nr:OmpA family protein [Pleurocapsa sp. CCALA 161]PSB09165.1 cell envelope biogenesis protein OmpA [Pleurocapsa sp. CCALA 161]
MNINRDKHNLISQVLLTVLTVSGVAIFSGQTVTAQTNLQSYRILVNSDRDTINPDQSLTLREAIEIVNNTLTWDDLSAAEQKQVTVINQPQASQIEFALAAPIKIELQETLPPLLSPGLVIDGTTHPNYDSKKIATVEIPIPIPVVSLTAAEGKNVFRGLTISGDRITVKGLSIHGFSQPNQPTDTTPGADIVIGSRLPVSEDLSAFLPDHPPQNVEIIDNWLGLPPDESLNSIPSSFGIWLFDGVNTKIQRNRIYHHGGSGILTSVTAQKTQIKANIIVGNGLQGMPHAIYLEGQIQDSQITDNLICGNDGSGVYLFKPEGAIAINHNTIKFNGRRVPSAAVYLIGNDHQVTNNQISWQTGTGVTVTAYPQSDRNLITNNTFNDLEGLSIDLNTRDRDGRVFYQLGDGVNPPRDSRNRKRDTANKSINAPQFLSENFYLIDGKVNIDGLADPGSTVTLYRVKLGIPRKIKEQSPLASQSDNYGPLSEPLTEAVADRDGKFSFTLDNLTPGTIISAIATKPDYGTSEPAFNATINSLNQSKATIERSLSLPNCTTKPVVEIAKPPVQPEIKPSEPIKLNVPRNIHFALDRANISPASAKVLNQIATVLKLYPYMMIELQGHTDFRASDQYNLDLSRRRADATRNYLLQQGVDPARMAILPLGESKLEKPGNTIVDHAYNRRVEVIFHDLRGVDIIFENQDADLQLE